MFRKMHENAGDHNDNFGFHSSLVLMICQALIKGANSILCIVSLLQSSGVFAEGIAGAAKKRYGGGGGGGGGGGERDSANFIPKPKLNLQVISMKFCNLSA
jgi:hypothetical protein